jgi:carbamoyl-phosphate synthase large subunit
MPKRTDIKSILIIGAGPSSSARLRVRLLGRAGVQGAAAGGLPRHPGEFQPATIMTDPDLADATYIEPITPDVVARIIAEGKAGARCCPPWAGRPRSTPRWRCIKPGKLKEFGVEADRRQCPCHRSWRRTACCSARRWTAIGLESPKGRARLHAG